MTNVGFKKIIMIEKRNVTTITAFNYLRKQLDMGISLSQCISKLPLENGSVYSFVPEDVSDEVLYNFEFGGVYPFDIEKAKATRLSLVQNDARTIVLSEIQNYLDESEVNCCIFEEPNASPDFPWVKTSGMEYVHLNNQEMFFFFDKENNDKEKVRDAFTTSEVYIFLCVLSELNKEEISQFAAFKEIRIDALELFTKNMKSFFVRAYDGEGYLMWTARQ
jgi:hypothetical protein